jgi:hypothetical protein
VECKKAKRWSNKKESSWNLDNVSEQLVGLRIFLLDVLEKLSQTQGVGLNNRQA